MGFVIKVIRKILEKITEAITVILKKCESKIKKNRLPYLCPCCGTYLSHFVDGEFTNNHERYNPERYKGIDQEVICPVCRALPRHRILVSWMSERIELLSDSNILYFAQEKSVKKWCNRNHIKCTTADLYNKADLKIDIEDTCLEDSSYDIIVCNHVLEHVSDYKKALNELHRIIKPTGMVIISFPVDLTLRTVYEDSTITSEADCIKHFGQNDHRRIFGRDSKELLESYGFIVSDISAKTCSCDSRIKPVVGPADYDYNVLWCLTKK